jgi:type IV secretory pathway TraG/TraD family ATPase VirD4
VIAGIWLAMQWTAARLAYQPELGGHGSSCFTVRFITHGLSFRSGKGAGFVIPILLGWTGSAVVHDIKGENWELTAGWRSRFSRCLLRNPTDVRSARYNPLLEVRSGPNEVRNVQNIADILIDPAYAIACGGDGAKR